MPTDTSTSHKVIAGGDRGATESQLTQTTFDNKVSISCRRNTFLFLHSVFVPTLGSGLRHRGRGYDDGFGHRSGANWSANVAQTVPPNGVTKTFSNRSKTRSTVNTDVSKPCILHTRNKQKTMRAMQWFFVFDTRELREMHVGRRTPSGDNSI